VNVTKSLRLPNDLPRIRALSYVDYDNFEKKIASAGNRYLLEYHEMTKHRLEIAEFCLRLLLDNYNNDIAFVGGLTSFLVQAKVTLDSLCQEINLYCELNIGQRPNYTTDTEELTEPRNLLALSKKNAKLSKFVVQELSASNPWFATFKILHDSEGVHRQHSPRLMPSGIAAHDIEVGDVKVAEFCMESLSRINQVTEACYGLMM
jgi:hypothetical protein